MRRKVILVLSFVGIFLFLPQVIQNKYRKRQFSTKISPDDVTLTYTVKDCLHDLKHPKVIDMLREAVKEDEEKFLFVLKEFVPNCISNKSKKFLSSFMKLISNAIENVDEGLELEYENPWVNRSHLVGNLSNLCPAESPHLEGRIEVSFEDTGEIFDGKSRWNWPPTLEEVALEYQDQVQLGGIYVGPPECTCRGSSAIIVPFRDRNEHLRFFLHYTHELLRRQQLCYVIIVVEQEDHKTFNKGQLMNTAFQYAKNITIGNHRAIDCFIFHDVDILAEDDRIIYTCRDNNTINHVAPLIDKYNYTFCCGITVGAVVGFTKEQFEDLNGYSNEFTGWGGEDDDMDNRIKYKGYNIWRSTSDFTRFRMVKHGKDEKNPDNENRMKMLEESDKRQDRDGLNSLETIITSVVKYPTHTRIKVKTNPTEEELKYFLQ